jgi:hypothetical protein
VVDCTVEGLLHAPELPTIMKGVDGHMPRLLMVSNEHPEILERTVPDQALEGVVRSAMKKLRAAQLMHVTSAAGTDLRVKLKHGDQQAVVGGVWGFCPKPGMVSHWPAGLALAFPAAGSVNGTLVMAPGDVNLTFKSYLRDTIRLTIENDSVVAIDGQGVDVDMMRGYYKAWEDADYEKMEDIRRRAETIVEDKETAEKLKAWYRQLCKRPCFHDDYLPTFNRPNVTLIDTGGKGVERVTAKGVVVDGEEIALDCLIFATGFEVGTNYTRRAGYDIIGRNGQKLSEKWGEGLRTLHGLQTNGFPNCFFLGFTQSAVTVNVPQTLNEQACHVTYILSEVKARGATITEATAEGEAAWLAEMDSKAKMGEQFRSECTPGYYNNEGKTGNRHSFFEYSYGAGPLRFFEILKDWRASGTLEGSVIR